MHVNFEKQDKSLSDLDLQGAHKDRFHPETERADPSSPTPTYPKLTLLERFRVSPAPCHPFNREHSGVIVLHVKGHG